MTRLTAAATNFVMVSTGFQGTNAATKQHKRQPQVRNPCEVAMQAFARRS